MCHGYEDTNGRGGFGLELCKESLTLNTVGQLAPWSGNLSYGITIYSCAAADATQIYHHGPVTAIDFGRWEGNLLAWNARGTLVGAQGAPQQSRLHG